MLYPSLPLASRSASPAEALGDAVAASGVRYARVFLSVLRPTTGALVRLDAATLTGALGVLEWQSLGTTPADVVGESFVLATALPFGYSQLRVALVLPSTMAVGDTSLLSAQVEGRYFSPVAVDADRALLRTTTASLTTLDGGEELDRYARQAESDCLGVIGARELPRVLGDAESRDTLVREVARQTDWLHRVAMATQQDSREHGQIFKAQFAMPRHAPALCQSLLAKRSTGGPGWRRD